MLGDITPKSLKFDMNEVVYPGRDHTVSLQVSKLVGRRYVPVDFDDLTRVVVVFPTLDPVVVFDSATQTDVFTWSGDTIEVDMTAYAMPQSALRCQMIVFDAEHTRGQVLVDNIDSTLEFDFRNVSTTGTTPTPTVEPIGEAPIDGTPYARQDADWVSIPEVVAAVTSVNGETGEVVLDAEAVGAEYPLTAGANISIDRTNPDAPVVALVESPAGLTSVGFDTAAGHTVAVGEVAWNATDSTLDLGLTTGTVLQIGQEFLIKGRNTSGTTMADGTVVYVSGAQGYRPVFTRAQANAASADKTIGVITSPIGNNADGFCTLAGLVRNFDTSGWSEGAELWLSADTAGAMTTTKPAAPNSAVRVGQVIRSHPTLGQILVRVQSIPAMTELHDVTITAPEDGQVLLYDEATDTWVNGAASTGSGEANTASNLGSGTGVFAGKVSADLQFKSLVEGSGVTISSTATEITITASGASGAVDSVNGQTGVVVLDTDDIDEGASNLWYTNTRASAAAPVQSVDGQTGVVDLSDVYAPLSHVDSTDGHPLATTTDDGFMSSEDKTKLDGVASDATANQSDSYLLDRDNHTGTQAATTVTVADAGDYFTGTNVETVLQEVGLALESAGGGSTDWDALSEPTISSGTLTLNVSVPRAFAVTLDQDVTTLSITGAPAGKAPAFAVQFTQDATGGRAITWPASIVGTPPTLATGAGEKTVISFVSFDEGTTWVISGAVYA